MTLNEVQHPAMVAGTGHMGNVSPNGAHYIS